MGLYELVAIVRPGSIVEVKEIAREAGHIVLKHAGVIRGFTNWGIFLLPKPRTVLGKKYATGHHFIMRFDGTNACQMAVKRSISGDPRTMRKSVVKLGETLSEIKDIPGEAEWRTFPGGNKDEAHTKATEGYRKRLEKAKQLWEHAQEQRRDREERQAGGAWAAGTRPKLEPLPGQNIF